MPVVDFWWLDLKLGLRMLVKFPGLTLAGVLGIAVAVAIAVGGFSVVYENLLATSLPLEDGDRIVALELWDSRANVLESRLGSDFLLWRDGLQKVREVSAFQTLTLNLIEPGTPPEGVRVASMSASGFAVARVQPLMGRYLASEDERTGAPAVVVIGEDVWRNRFGGDPRILGRSIKLGATPHTIVGVMPQSYGFPVNHRFWIPLRFGIPPGPMQGPSLAVFGRLAPGASIAEAEAELATLGQRSAAEFPGAYASLRPRVAPYTASVLKLQGGDDMGAILTMQGLVVGLLVLVCLNVAILVYTRTAMRQSEIGLRTALGATRGRIVPQLFIEALVLSGIATVVGVGLAALALRQVTGATEHIAGDLPFWITFRLAPGAVLYAAVLSVLAAAIIGIVPGLQATGRDLQPGLRIAAAGDTGMRLGRTWSVLIVAQVGFAVALLPISVRNVLDNLPFTLAGPGFAAEEYLTAHLSLESAMESEAGEPGTDRFAIRHAELMRRLSSDPRIVRSTFSSREPGDERGHRVEADHAPGVIYEARVNLVEPGFFQAFSVPFLAGRTFQASDISAGRLANPPQGAAVVINQILAERLFGGNALGRRIRYAASDTETAASPTRWYEVVGVVQNFPSGVSAAMRDSQLRLYHPVSAGQIRPAVLSMQVRGAAPAFAQVLREAALAVDPDLVLREVRTLDAALRKEQWIVRLEASLVLAVTLSVLLLSSAGIYALMSFTVAQRRREIGIRMALGASRLHIVTSVFSRALLQLGAGALIGAVLGGAIAKLTGGPGANANTTLAVIVLMITAIGLLAASGPTRRSLRIQPSQALREQ